MSGLRRITLFFILLVALTLVTPGPGAGQEPVETFNAYLPIVHTAPTAIYGRVTDSAIAAPGVSLELRFYDGSGWSTRMTTITDSAGNYRFQNPPALTAGQQYLVRYRNEIDQSRLGVWETRHLTSFPGGSHVDLGSFDIANIALNSPIDGYEATLPRIFTWAPRQNTPNDSYRFNLFDIYDESYTPKFSTEPLGNTDTYRLTGLPPGFYYCNPYYWAVTVHSSDGGWGGSLWAYGVTFYAHASYSGIYGCVTNGGAPVSGVSVDLRRWNYMTGEDISVETGNTLSGIFSFTGKPATLTSEYYYVQYSNAVNPDRLALYQTYPTFYQAGSTEHIGDFDIANIQLGMPDGDLVSLPYTFQWTSRPATASDDYELDLFGQGGSDPNNGWYSLGYTDSFLLGDLPAGFLPDVPYEWNVWVNDLFGGNGISYETHAVTFSLSGMLRMLPALAERQGVVLPTLKERLRLRRQVSGAPNRPPALAPRQPDYERLKGER